MNIDKRNTPVIHSEEGLCEYVLVINPDAAVQEKVLEEKQRFAGDYDQDIAAQFQSQIMVASFFAREEMEETLMRWIQRVCDQHQQFIVTLNNYSGIPPHTIYLRVLDPRPFTELAQQLRSIDDWIQSSSCPPLQLHNRPFLSLTRPLPEPIYTKAMFSYSQRTFHESFMATELRLMRRMHRFDASKTINIFPLARNQRQQEVA
jgi:hypothetical protein